MQYRLRLSRADDAITPIAHVIERETTMAAADAALRFLRLARHTAPKGTPALPERWEVQAWDGDEWATLATGDRLGTDIDQGL